MLIGMAMRMSPRSPSTGYDLGLEFRVWSSGLDFLGPRLELCGFEGLRGAEGADQVEETEGPEQITHTLNPSP